MCPKLLLMTNDTVGPIACVCRTDIFPALFIYLVLFEDFVL